LNKKKKSIKQITSTLRKVNANHALTISSSSNNLAFVSEQRNIQIKINEKEISIPSNTSLFHLRSQFNPDADLIIYNGFPAASDCTLQQGDEVVLIQKGKIPSPAELECFMMARHTPGIHQKIKNSVVAIAGLGGLGSSVAVALARVGVGKLILVDFDLVEPSNLNRQQYFVDQIGLPKTEALRKNIAAINPCVKVETYQQKLDRGNGEKILQEADVVVEAFDRAEEKALLINIVSEKMPDKYIVAASGVAGYGDSNEIKTVRFSSKIFIVGDQKTAAQPGMGLMAPRVGIVAHHQANVVLRILLGEEK
jgi:sulfur carrier protein ThiS adenylyltransferase